MSRSTLHLAAGGILLLLIAGLLLALVFLPLHQGSDVTVPTPQAAAPAVPVERASPEASAEAQTTSTPGSARVHDEAQVANVAVVPEVASASPNRAVETQRERSDEVVASTPAPAPGMDDLLPGPPPDGMPPPDEGPPPEPPSFGADRMPPPF